MKPRSFIILAAVCAVLAAVSYGVLRSRSTERDPNNQAGAALMANLPVNDIQDVHIQLKDGTVHLKKGKAVWEVADRFGYPAAFDRTSDFVKKIRDMKIGCAL